MWKRRWLIAGVLDRVCEIYQKNTGVAIDPEQLKAAFGQAMKEKQGEAMQSWLQKLVSEGKIIQKEANQYLKWWQSRPDIELPLSESGGHGHRGGMMWGSGKCGGSDEAGN